MTREHNGLNLAAHISQIKKDHLALVATNINPSRYGDLLPYFILQVFDVCAFHIV
jgi:hypothetical protein